MQTILLTAIGITGGLFMLWVAKWLFVKCYLVGELGIQEDDLAPEDGPYLYMRVGDNPRLLLERKYVLLRVARK